MKKFIAVMCMLLPMLMLFGCGKNTQPEGGNVYQVYEVNREDTKIQSRQFVTTESGRDNLIPLLLLELQQIPSQTDMRPAIPDYVEIKSTSCDEGSLLIDFGDGYHKLSRTAEVLTRAAIVRTLSQIEGVNYVSFLIDGIALENSYGVPIGTMSADQFIDNSGNEINTQEKVSLALFYGSKKGDQLIKVNREVVYNRNISLEKLVLEQLILGTSEDEMKEMGAYAVINPDTKIISVMVSDGICYVNVDPTFLTQLGSASAEVVIYSIVNSLAELSDINKVQISVDGKTNLAYKEVMPLSQIYERNLELVAE